VDKRNAGSWCFGGIYRGSESEERKRLRDFWLVSKAVNFTNWQQGPLSRLRKQFIVLNVYEDREVERKQHLRDLWEQLALFKAALTDTSIFTNYLQNQEAGEPSPVNAYEGWMQYQMMHPEWFGFELTEQERQDLSGSTT